MKNERVIYYSDPLHDDFAGNGINTRQVPGDFCYVHESLGWRMLSFIVYYIIAFPLVWLTAKLVLGLKFRNRKVMRKLRGQGFFLYGNHTQILDAYVPSLAAFPKKAYIVANPDAVSIPGLRHIVMMLGTLPVPSELSDPKLVRMLNPTCYLGLPGADNAKHWRVRHGAFDRDTSLAIPVILATLLQNRGLDVDFRLPWGLPHSGDYDLKELFGWIDSLMK